MEDIKRELVERLIDLRGSERLDDLVAMYAADAVVARHRAVAHGRDEIRSFFVGYHSAHGRFDLRTMDAITMVDDLVVFEASVDTDLGVLQIADVLVVGDDGLIARHVIGQRGFWGK